MDLALLSVLREGLLRHSEAVALTWSHMELRDNGLSEILPDQHRPLPP